MKVYEDDHVTIEVYRPLGAVENGRVCAVAA
jgi:hypothetical protein